MFFHDSNDLILLDLHQLSCQSIGHGSNDLVSWFIALFRDAKDWSDEGWAWYDAMSWAFMEKEAEKAQAVTKSGDIEKGEGGGEPGARSTARPVSHLKQRFIL